MIEFYNDNQIQKISRHDAALLKLRRYLDANEPKLVYFLQRLWDSQKRAITYKELREAILSGALSVELLEEWQQDYSAFLLEHLQPMWLAAMAEAADQLEKKYRKFFFNPMADGVQQWVSDYGAAFVTNSSQTQLDALQSVIRMATRLEDYTVDELSRAIRPIVGLNEPQALANMKYYNTMRGYGLSHKKALEKSMYYAERQHRQRGYLIARTELAFGYNKGEYLAIKQAQERGFLGRMVKVWCTADDERVCFPKNTMIATAGGKRAIQDIKVGDKVLTPDGEKAVLNTMKHDYKGNMTIVTAGDKSVYCTENHPFKTEEGWLKAGLLRPDDTVYFTGDKSGNVDTVINFCFTNSDNEPTVRMQFFIAPRIFDFVGVPVIPVNLKGYLDSRDGEVDRIASDLIFGNKINFEGCKCFRNFDFKGCGAIESTITREGTKAPCFRCTRDNSEFFSAIGAFNENRRPSTFFRTEMPVKTFFCPEYLSTAFAGDIFSIGSSAFDGTDGVPICNGLADLKLFATDRANLSYHNGLLTGEITFVGAEFTKFVAWIEGFSAMGADSFTMNFLHLMGASNGAVNIFSFCPLLSFNLFSAISASIVKHINHLKNIIPQLNQEVYTTVYNLEVESIHVYYANDFLVHNCNHCGPMEGKKIALDEPFDYATRLDGWTRLTPPLHPNCRCGVIYEEIEPPQKDIMTITY